MKGVRSLELGRQRAALPAGVARLDDERTTPWRCGSSSPCRTTAACGRCSEALDRGWSRRGRARGRRRSTPGSCGSSPRFVELRAWRRSGPGSTGSTRATLRRLKRAGFGDARASPASSARPRRRCASGARAAGSCRPTSASTRARPSSSRSRRTCTARTSRSASRTRTAKKKVVILGSGPNRIGQGIEFDYCCCHAAFALREEGFETVMVNCNPETVSTDYDTADRLYFEPLTFEDVMAIIEKERSAGGDVACLVQFGGQTPLKLALPLQEAGVRILGTSPDSIDLAEDRKRFSALLRRARRSRSRPAARPRRATRRARWRRASASRSSSARRTCSAGAAWPSSTTRRRSIATWPAPWTRRPSTRCSSTSSSRTPSSSTWTRWPTRPAPSSSAASWSTSRRPASTPATAPASCRRSSCAERHLETIRDYTRRIARALNVVGLMNVQYAIKDDVVYVLEVNPRASRTVPYLSKATGVPLAKVAARVMAGRTLARPRAHGGPRGGRRVREEPGVPVRPLPGRRHDPRARDEVDRRGHGRRRAASARRSRKAQLVGAGSGCRRRAPRSSA